MQLLVSSGVVISLVWISVVIVLSPERRGGG